MAQRGSLVGSVVLVAALLGATAPWSRALPACEEIAAADRERARLAGRCEGRAPITSVDPATVRGRNVVREAAMPRRPVPDLRGRLFNHRDERLARFVVAIDYRESAQKRDWVLDQVPRPPAALSEGASLRVVLSDGALVRVPDVRGAYARALALLYRAGLAWPPGDGGGAVVGQTPAPGTAVRPGTQIALRLAPGPLALAPESTRPEVAPPPAARPSAPPPAPATTPRPPASTSPSSTSPSSTAPALPSGQAAGVTMPDLQGMSFDAARERLAGFSVQRVHRGGTEPGGTVIGQSPAPGAPLAAGTSVRLVLSDGSLVRVPRVTSFTLAEARQRLAAGELRPVVTNVPSDARAGTVTSQQPAEGAIAERGSTIRINVSAGPAAATAAAAPLPNFVGSTLERSRTQLAAYKVERSERAAREPVGTILEQSPPAGTAVERGGTVSVVVSSGGRPEVIELANVVGQDTDAATRTLSEFRIERVAVPGTEPAGRVLEQDPAPGASVPPGSTVRLRVSDASLVPVPSLAHMTLAQARAAARAAGVDIAVNGGSDDAAAVVQAQQPAAGTTIRRGTALRVDVEERGPTVAWPPALRDALARGSTLLQQPPPRNLAMALVGLLALLALLMLARRRTRVPDTPPTEPVFAPRRWGDTAPRPAMPPAPRRADASRRAAPATIPASVARSGETTVPASTPAPPKAPIPPSLRADAVAPAADAPSREAPPVLAPPVAVAQLPEQAPLRARATPSAQPTPPMQPAPPVEATPTAPAPPAAAVQAPRPVEATRPALFTRRKEKVAPTAAPRPEPEPVIYGATARFDVDAARTVAVNVTPRGPEIRIAAHLRPGETRVVDLPAAPAPTELSEETK